MEARSNKVGCWPTQQQELLFRAALLQGKDAIECWQEWKSNVDISLIDDSSLRLLPQLYRNLQMQGVTDPLMVKLKEFYQRAWSENQILFHNMAGLLNRLHNAGIQTMILKGAALLLLYYKDYGLRPMLDFDILVHTAQAATAFDLLVKWGWMSKIEWPEKFQEPHIYFRNDYGFINITAKQKIDVHRHVLRKSCQANADDDFWKAAVPVKFNNVSTCALNPADQLLHVCVHGEEWHFRAEMHLLADAMIILNYAKSEINWDRLIGQAEERGFILPLRDVLEYLADVLHAPIPPAVLRRLQTISASKKERRVYEIKTKSRRQTIFNVLLVHFDHYIRLVEGFRLQQKFIWFPKYIQHVWSLESLWKLPFFVISKSVGKIWNSRKL